MPDPNEIKIVEYNDVDSLSLSIPDDVTNISIGYDQIVDNIEVEYVNDITDIVVSVGEGIQSVYSVNSFLGAVTLTYSEILSSISASLGIYSYTINHNLSSNSAIASVYNGSNDKVIVDYSILGYNSIKINSLKNLNGYKVVVQV